MNSSKSTYGVGSIRILLLILLIFCAESVSAKPMVFYTATTGGTMPGSVWIVADGEIVEDTPKRFEEFLGNNFCGEVVLNSPGGHLLASLKLGDLITNRCHETSVGYTKIIGIWSQNKNPVVYEAEKYDGVFDEQKGICASACVYAFLGGKNRNVSNSHSALLIHQFYQEKGLIDPSGLQFRQVDVSAAQATMGLLIEYITRKKADPRLAMIAANTPPTKLYELTEIDVDSLHIRYDEKKLRPPKLDLYKGRLNAYSDSDDGRIFFLSCSPKRKELVVTYEIPLPIINSDVDAKKYINEAYQAAENPEFGGAPMDKKRIHVSVENNAIWIRINFSPYDNFQRFKDFNLYFSAPMTAINLLSVNLESKNTADLMKIISKQCSNI